MHEQRLLNELFRVPIHKYLINKILKTQKKTNKVLTD
jgi:hypothetical protein